MGQLHHLNQKGQNNKPDQSPSANTLQSLFEDKIRQENWKWDQWTIDNSAWPLKEKENDRRRRFHSGRLLWWCSTVAATYHAQKRPTPPPSDSVFCTESEY